MPILAHKIRLFPSEDQEVAFAKAAGVARFTYNWALAECKRIRAETGKNPNIGELKKQFNALKKEDFPWIYDSPKDANQQPFTNLKSAWRRFWNGKKQGKLCVWDKEHKKKLLSEGIKTSKMAFAPTFKRKKDGASFYVSNDKFSVSGKSVKLPLIGKMAMAEELRFSGKIMAGNVSRHGDDWFLSVQVEVPDSEYFRERTGDGVSGVDLGIKSTAVLSDGQVFASPKPLKKALRRLAIRQRRASRKLREQLSKLGLKGKAIPKGMKIPKSKNVIKAEAAIRRIHGRVKNVRSDFQHKLTTKICSENQAVVIEDLNVVGMMQNKKLSRALADIGMGEIRRRLAYKSLRYKTALTLADRWYPSSKTCSCCGWLKPTLLLCERSWVCEDCGTIHDRDTNAAANLRNLILKLPVGLPESHACQI
jgi:putative transposase